MLENYASFAWKILSRGEAAGLVLDGVFSGSADDLRDGFIHLSTGDQVIGTLTKHFAGQERLVAACIDPARLGTALRWEPSRGGDLFPHLYRPLSSGDVEFLIPEAENRLPRLF